MTRLSFLLLPVLCFACQESPQVNSDTLAALGHAHKTAFTELAQQFQAQIETDSTQVQAHVGLAEAQIILYIFGFSSREETLPMAKAAAQAAWKLDSLNSRVQALAGKIHFLDWRWQETQAAFRQAIQTDPLNNDARHWYSLYLTAMGHMDAAMAQSDTIMTQDPAGDYVIGRGSLHYFARENEALKKLMLVTIAADTTIPWGYDWLGMAYVELKAWDHAIATYQRAFTLSDGTAEVGAGLGHALGLAGHYAPAKQMADFYAEAAQRQYVPPVQRAFIHLGIDEYEEAIRLLEQAYEEHSWFLIFMQIEPWYDPIRADERFQAIIHRMNFPEKGAS